MHIFKLSKLSKPQLKKTSDYLIDLSKLLIGSTIVAVFVPDSTGGDFNFIAFTVGLLLAIATFTLGLKFVPQPKI